MKAKGATWGVIAAQLGQNSLLCHSNAKHAFDQTGTILFQAAKNVLITWKQGGKRMCKYRLCLELSGFVMFGIPSQ